MMKLFSLFRKLLLLAGLLFVVMGLYHCANVIAPTGGPKDITPPKVLKCTPANHSTGFTGNKFSITFDEFVKLDKITQQLLVSPPMAETPDFRIKKKTLSIRFKEALKPNTTYSVFFGDAIEDITEGNPLHNYTYVFSTGTSVDSMSLRGQVVNAEDLKPAEDVFVMLYKNDNDTIPLDSLPLLVKPYYLSKTDKQGNFMFSGLADTSYLIFALKDENYSLTFDQPNEKIAFLDSLVKPQYRPAPHIDSTILDTLVANLPSDSAQMVSDSLWHLADSIADAKLTFYQLYLFQEADSVQKLMKAGLIRPNTVQFVFNIPGKSISVQSIDYHPDSVWYRSEWSKSRDTLLWFLRLPHPDTLNLLVFNGKDTLDSLSLRVIPKPKLVRKKRKKDTLKKKKVYLTWKTSTTGNIKPGQKLVLTFDQPVEKVIPDSILLVQNKDSLYHPAFTFLDSLHRQLYFPVKIKDGTSYQLSLPDSSVIDWNHFFNKKIVLSLHAKALKEYSSLNITLEPEVSGDYIFEILSEKEKPVAIRYFSGKTVLHFPRINPGKYLFKVIFDRNGNKKWDPGNYLKKQLPEKVIYFKNLMTLRANWEINEKWEF
jgi:hypothetical protein